MIDKLTVDSEFESILGRLSPMEEEEMRGLLEQEGWRAGEYIYVWANHDNTIVEGHNRYRLCQELGIQFKVKALSFPTRDDVKKWIYRNQAGRHNLTAEQLSYIRGKVYEAEKKTHGSAPGEARKLSKPQDADLKISTADAIGKEFNVSGDTILRDHKFGKHVDAEVAKVPDEEKAAKKAELLKSKDGRKNKDAAGNNKVRGGEMPWNNALAKAAKRGKPIGKDEFTELLGIEPSKDKTTARKGLSVLAQSKGFIVERNGAADSYRVSRAFVMPMKSDDTPPDLLHAIKARALQAKEDLLDSHNASVRWTLCVDFANDLLAMLKDVK